MIMQKKLLTLLVLLMTAVSGAWATITVTWNNDDITGSGTSFTKDGVTITAGDIDFGDKNFMGGGTFTTTLGNFTKIEVTTELWMASGTGWSGSTWTGTPASSVSFSGDFLGMGNTKFVFTIEPATVAVTGVTLAPTEATLTLGETETVTLIPTVLPAEATDKSVTWSSSDETVATVTDGVVTAVAAGTATITVTTTDGAKTATCAVTVAAPAASTYTVTLKEGTEDATSWTIAPAEATTTGVAAGTTVTATYNGTKKVKSVKAVKKAAPSYTMAAAATTSDKGKLICTAGHIHVYGEDAACTAGRVAKIIYVGPTGHATYNHGLALALEDMSTLLTWDNSGANNDGKTAAEWCSAWNTSKPVTDAEWLLASKDQWNYMLGTNGAGSSTTLLDGFTSVGGSNLESQDYWSSTEYESNTDEAWMFNFGYDWWYDTPKNRVYPLVRACLAF